MSISYPSTDLPMSFTRLLCMNFHDSKRMYDGVRGHIYSHPDLQNLIEFNFVDIDPQGRIEFILKSLGWQNLRNRLASIYLQKSSGFCFTEKSEPAYVESLVKLEKIYSKNLIQGQSRFFLLIFYIKMALLESKQDVLIDYNDNNVLKETSFLNNQVLNLLNYTKRKTTKIDWLVIILSHFSEFLGITYLETKIKDDTNFKTLFNMCNSQQKSLMVKNLLNYGYSIGEPDMFIGEIV